MFDDKFIGQYHIGAYILASVILNDKSDDPLIVQKIAELLSNLRNILTTDEGVTNADFTLESICLAHYFTEEDHIKDLLAQFLLEHEICLHAKITAKATDYYLLRYFNVTYYNRYLGVKSIPDESTEVVVDGVLDTTGVLFDTYFEGVGNPDLVYHCRNLQILMSCYVICEDLKMKRIVENALSFIVSFSSVDGRIGYYGRSSDTIYGDSCVIMALALALSVDNSAEYRRFLKRFERIYTDIPNNKIKITEAWTGINGREGLDSYVYPMVYEIFALSRLCCAYASSRSGLNNNVKILKDVNANFKFDQLSGFLKIIAESGEIIINTKGHPKAPIRSNDSRYLPLRPLHHYSTKLIPPVPYKASIKPPNESKFDKLHRYLKDYLISCKYTKLNVGFIPYFVFRRRKYVIAETDIVRYEPSTLFLEAAKYYEYSQFFLKKKIVDASSRLECEINLDLNENLIIGYKLNSCVQCYYQISHFRGDKCVFDNGNVYINGQKIITFSAPIRFIPFRTTQLDTIEGRVEIKHVKVMATSSFNIKFL